MRKFTAPLASLTVLSLLCGCAQTPMGPRIQTYPGANKPFETYQQDDVSCRQYAATQVNGQAENANERAAGVALLGAALGTGVGAVAGGGRGAAVGAAVGGVAGTAVGAGSSQSAQGGIQQQYDNAYAACMTAKGNQVAQPVVVHPATIYYAPAPVYYAPAPVYAAPAPVYAAPPPAPVYAPPPGAAIPPPPPNQ